MQISYGTLGGFNLLILYWLQQPFLPTPRHVLEEEEVCPLFVGAKPQVLLAPRNVIFTEDLVLMQITAVLHAVLGKLQSRREEEELNSLPVGSLLIYLQDVLTNRQLLVDTGASCSVFPHHSSAAPTGPRLLMADGRPTDGRPMQNSPSTVWRSPFPVSFPACLCR